MNNFLLIIYLVSLCLLCSADLPTLNINEISVSGISGGAYFATQFHVAFSSCLSGVGSIAGGPYYCAQSNLLTAMNDCMKLPALINIGTLISKAREFERRQKIDPLENLKRSKYYILNGLLDTTVVQDVGKKAYMFYDRLGVPHENIKSKFNILAQHAMPTDDYGKRCEYLGEPWINNCNLSAAGEILSHLHGDLKSSSKADPNNLKTFDQSSYLSTKYGFSKLGYYYIATGCLRGEECKLHVVFHGCQQYHEKLGTLFVEKSGYNKWAEANNFVILYPQITPTVSPYNPRGCFDWWGYNSIGNPSYAWKEGPQMKAVANMISKIIGKPFGNCTINKL